MKAKTPITADLAPYTRVDAHGQAWGDRFVVFGGAMFKKDVRPGAMEGVEPDGGEGVHGVRAVRPAQAPGTGDEHDRVESINPRNSHSARAQLFADVWVLEQRWGGAFSQMNWFWTLIKPQRSSLVPMGRYDGATMLDETRNTLYVFGGRSYNRSFNDLWTFDLLERVWREISPTRRPAEPRHGAGDRAAQLRVAFPFGTADERPRPGRPWWPANATWAPAVPRDLVLRLDRLAQAGHPGAVRVRRGRLGSACEVVRHPADCGTCAKKKCAEGR